jgi:hypothetical protein
VYVGVCGCAVVGPVSVLGEGVFCLFVAFCCLAARCISCDSIVCWNVGAFLYLCALVVAWYTCSLVFAMLAWLSPQ